MDNKKPKKVIEYSMLAAINNSLFRDGIIDEDTQRKIASLLNRDYLY